MLQDKKPERLIQEFKCEDFPVLRLEMDRPELPAPLPEVPARRLRRHYRRFERLCLNLCRKRLLPRASEAFRLALAESRPFSPLTLSLRSTVTRSGPGFFSLYWDLSLAGSGAEDRRALRFSDNWDLRTGCPVRMEDLFPSSYRYKKRLPDAAAKQIDPEAGDRGRTRRRCRRLFSKRNFYLDETRLYYFFPSSGGPGPSVFSVPLPAPERVEA
jgi:hypothetical protein